MPTTRSLCWLAAMLLLSAAIGCTPTRHRIPPPYPYLGETYTAEEIVAIATQNCHTETAAALPPNAFTTDGCSLWPDGAYRECCVAHDMLYWCAGPSSLRKSADRSLRECVAGHSTEFNAFLMYWGVRAGGGRLVPFSWRWGYGYPWVYRPPVEPPEPGDDQPLTGRVGDSPWR